MRDWRIKFLFLFFLILFGVFVFRLYHFQIVKGEEYFKLAQNQQDTLQKISPKRGAIFFSDKKTCLARQEKCFTILIDPLMVDIKNIEKSIELLGSNLNLNTSQKNRLIENIKEKRKEGLHYLKVSNEKVSEIKKKEIQKLDISGIYFEEEGCRFYPQGELAAHLVGFYSEGSNEGYYGVEGFYDSVLKGVEGKIKGKKDAYGRIIPNYSQVLKQVQDGDDLILTIDFSIQSLLESKLKELVEKYGPEAATGVIMNPKTGEILAMASLPNFNPNEYDKADEKSLNNVAMQAFEQGSIFKPITMAAGIEENVVNPQTTYEDKGFVTIDNRQIYNWDRKGRGTANMIKVMEESLNTGAVFVEQKLGKEKFLNYIQKFGFGEKTGIDLQGESPGDIRNLFSPREIECANASFGQGFSATPVQILQAFSAIANGGKMVRPYVVKERITPSGKIIKTKTEVVASPISAETAARVSAMMVSVVKNGFGKKADVEGYLIAGKTGTAQVPDIGGYSSEVSTHTFISFAPALDPQFEIYIALLKQRNGQIFASDSIAPVVKDISSFLLAEYFKIPPSEK
ncbi:MAG: penicillin-binding protein 2 [Candidatus Pacebacteria bacterium]|nr:penicillin-binding protein 2 [Candidatus Paceibacterota bacterium]